MMNVSIVSVHCVKNDAISNIMKAYADWIRAEAGYKVKCYGYHTEYTQEELPFQRLEHASQLLLDPHFQSSNIVIFQFGIYCPLMDLISLVPSHAKALAIFHNIAPKEFVTAKHNSLIDKSLLQLHNLKLADYVAYDSATNLKDLRALGINTPATVLPLWVKKIYGTPRYKPSFYDHITRIVFLGRFVRSKGGLDLLSALDLYLSQSKQTGSANLLQLTVICNQEHSDAALFENAQLTASTLENKYKGVLKVDFVLNAPDSVKFQVFQDADIFALPTYHEGFCVPVLEALSNGCSVVAYDNSNAPFVAGVDAHLAETGNIESLTLHLAAAISKVNGDTWWSAPDTGYLAFIRRSNQHLNQFSAGKARQRLFALFKILTNTKSLDMLRIDSNLLEPNTLALPEERQLQRPKGVNVLGFLSGILGLGEAARAVIHSLNFKKSDVLPLELIDFRVDSQSPGVEQTFQHFESDFKYAINLTMVNCPELIGAMERFGDAKFQGRYNIGLWYWELMDVNPEWHPGFKLVDELWATTDYIKESLMQSSTVPVHKVTFPITIDMSKVSSNRESFDLPANTFLFIFAFDHNSIMSRKNPMAVIEAYRLAFGDRRDVGLVIKSLNSEQQPKRQTELNAAIKDLNAFIVDGELERYQSFSLYAACDSYVSLHRAEGLGLAMAECMYMGKPVIATGYSGNMEFMNHSNSLPVRYDMVQIQEDQSVYRKGNWWAEPDIKHAADCMQLLVNDSNLCRKMGERAKEHIQTHFSLDKSHQSIYERLNDIVNNQGKLWGFVATE
jgi:glycosyltransferase involved in cell wall biosynthesis